MKSLPQQTLLQLAALYLCHHRLDEAITLLKALHGQGKDSRVDLALIYAWIQQGDYQAALNLSETMDLTQQPEAALLRARALLALGRPDEARAFVKGGAS